MTSEELDRQIEVIRGDLVRELGHRVDTEEIVAVCGRHYEELRRSATIDDFIPLLVHRFARDELVRGSRRELSDAA